MGKTVELRPVTIIDAILCQARLLGYRAFSGHSVNVIFGAIAALPANWA
jgi:hypothetical protein